MRYRLAVVATLVAVVVLAGCEQGTRSWGSQTLGVQLVAGRATVEVYTCAGGTPITAVSIVKPDIHAKDDPVLWEVVPSVPVPTRSESVVGLSTMGAVSGYRTVTPIGANLPSYALAAYVWRTRLTGFVTFKARELSASKLRVDPAWFGGKRTVDLAEFLRVNRTNC